MISGIGRSPLTTMRSGEGGVGLRSRDREAVLGPGGCVTKPRGEPHGGWDAGSEQARIIEVVSPAGFEEFFRG